MRVVTRQLSGAPDAVLCRLTGCSPLTPLRSVGQSHIHGLKLSLQLAYLLLKMFERAIGLSPFVVDFALERGYSELQVLASHDFAPRNPE